MSTSVPSLIREGVVVVGILPVRRNSSSSVLLPSDACAVSSTSTPRRQLSPVDELSLKQRSEEIFRVYDDNKKGAKEDIIRRKEEDDGKIGSTMGKVKRARKDVFRIRRGDRVKELEEDRGHYKMAEEMSPVYSQLSGRTSRQSDSDCGATRKNNKPQMEKKRRQREKQSLNQLREYVLTAYKVDPSRYMDKAEILEKTAKFMQHIMKKYYSIENKDCNGEFRLQDNATTCLSGGEDGYSSKQSEISNTSPCNSSHTSLKLNIVNTNGPSELSAPSRKDQVVTFIIPQLGSNFPITPPQIRQDNCNNYWSVGQSQLEQKVVIDNSSEKSTSLTSPTMKLVVNHNYYLNSSIERLSRDAVSTASAESYSREVLSPDTTTGNLSERIMVSPTDAPVSIAPHPDFISSYNHLDVVSNQRRIAPRITTSNLSDRNISQFERNLSLAAHQIPNNTLHRPWEK